MQYQSIFVSSAAGLLLFVSCAEERRVPIESKLSISSHQLEKTEVPVRKIEPFERLTLALESGDLDNAERVARNWLSASPRESTLWIVGNVVGRVRDELIQLSVEGWAQQNPNAALDWAMAEENASIWHITSQAISQVWAKTDPVASLSTPLDGLDSIDIQAFRIAAVSAWAEADAPAAAEWIAGRDELDITMATEVVHQWAALKPDAAKEWVAAQDFGEGTGTVLGAVVSGWAGRDTEKALTWTLEGTEPSDGLVDPVRDAIADWADRDPNAVGKWLGQLAASEWKDQLLDSFATSIAEVSPDAAAAWAVEIANPELRDRTVADVMGMWTQMDDEAAQQWLNAMGD